jgi:hypothetical protein
MTDITAREIRDLGAWERVMTRDFTTQTFFMPGTNAEFVVPMVFIDPIRPWAAWHPESRRTMDRFDVYMAQTLRD